MVLAVMALGLVGLTWAGAQLTPLRIVLACLLEGLLLAYLVWAGRRVGR